MQAPGFAKKEEFSIEGTGESWFGAAVCLAPRFRRLQPLGVVGEDSENRASSSRPFFLGGHKQPASRLHRQSLRVISKYCFIHVELARNRLLQVWGRGFTSGLWSTGSTAAQCPSGQGWGFKGYGLNVLRPGEITWERSWIEKKRHPRTDPWRTPKMERDSK